jgi:hypothetical protein
VPLGASSIVIASARTGSAQSQQITPADHTDYLIFLVTTGTALMPRSASNLATVVTVTFSSTEITSLVITSMERIGSP